jgi:hypothetical protein
MATGWSRAPKGSKPKDWSKEPIVVGVMSIVVVQMPDGSYLASAASPSTTASATGKYPNQAMRKLLEHLIEHPAFDGQL